LGILGLTEQMIIKHLELISDTAAAAAHHLTIFFMILSELILQRLIIN
jgi:hypothetical protein